MDNGQPDFEILSESSTAPISDTERRRLQRELQRKQRRERRARQRAPWYTLALSLVLLVIMWFVVGTLLGLQARRAVLGEQAIAFGEPPPTEEPDTPTPVVAVGSDDLTATEEALAAQATATEEAQPTATPTATATPTDTPTPTPIGGSLSGQVAYVTEIGFTEELALYDLSTGEETLLTDSPCINELTPRFSPDGELIAYSSNEAGGGRHIWVLEADDPDPRQLTQGILVDTWPVWSPEGDVIAYKSQVGSRFFINQVDLQGTVETIIQLPSLETIVDWSGEPEIITLYGRTVEDVLELQGFPVGAAQSTARFPITSAFGAIRHVDYSPDGQLAVYTATSFTPIRSQQIFLADATCPFINECVIEQITDEGNFFTPRFSPDGTLLVAGFNEVFDQERDIVILDLEGNIIERVTETPIDERDPVWRP